jgi:hypothetical protein
VAADGRVEAVDGVRLGSGRAARWDAGARRMRLIRRRRWAASVLANGLIEEKRTDNGRIIRRSVLVEIARFRRVSSDSDGH